MGQVNSESHRPSPRSRRAGRGPEDRRRRAGSSGSGTPVTPAGFRRLERHQPPEHNSGDSGRGNGGDRARESARDSAAAFVDGAHGSELRGRVGSAQASRPAASRTGRWNTFTEVWGPHIRRFAPGLLANHGVTVALAVAVAVILAVGTTFRAVPAYIGSLWLVANLAPLTVSGADLGVVPLLPAVVVLYAHSRRIRSACGSTVTVRGIRTLAALGVGIPAVLTVIAWLMVWDASHVFDVAPPNLFHALVTTVLVNAGAVGAGLGPKIWRALLLRRGLPTWPVESAMLAGRFVTVMVAAGAVAVGVGLLVNHTAVGRAYDIAGGFGGVLGLTVLSILYFPNLAVGGASVLMGGEMHIGEGSTSLFAVTNTTLPPLPVLAAVPNDPVPLGPVLLIVPAVLSAVTVYRWFAGRRFIESPLFTAVGAGICASVAGTVLSWVAGGDLGYYGSTGPLLWLAPLLFLLWLLLPSLVVFGWVTLKGRKVTESAGDEVPESGGSADGRAGGTDAPGKAGDTGDVSDGDGGAGEAGESDGGRGPVTDGEDGGAGGAGGAATGR